MTLAARCALLQSVLDEAHLDRLGIEHLHVFKHLVLVVEAAIKVNFVVHLGNRVVKAHLRDLVFLPKKRNLETSALARVKDFDCSRVLGAQILEDVESIV